MKKIIAATLIAACIGCTVIGCSKETESSENPEASDVAESAATTEDTTASSEDTTGETTAAPAETSAPANAQSTAEIYDALIEELRAARNGQADDNAITELAEKISYDTIYAYEDAIIYYTELDLDNNGTDELLIYQHIETSEYTIPVIYDAYTVTNGELVHFIAGGARNSYYLAADGSFYNMSSGGAAYSGFSKYTYANGALTPVNDYYYTDDKSGDVKWYHSNSGLWEDDGTEVTEEEALAFFDFDYMYIANKMVV